MEISKLIEMEKLHQAFNCAKENKQFMSANKKSVKS